MEGPWSDLQRKRKRHHVAQDGAGWQLGYVGGQSDDGHEAWSWSIENAERPALQHRSAEPTPAFLMQLGELRQQVEEVGEILPKRPLGTWGDVRKM